MGETHNGNQQIKTDAPYQYTWQKDGNTTVNIWTGSDAVITGFAEGSR